MYPQPCHGYANGCNCPGCRARALIVASHQAEGRHPYTHAGKLRPLPKPQAQPWGRAA